MYKHLSQLWKRPGQEMGDAYKRYLVQWRGESTVRRIAKPTRIDRARRLGYKAKQGIIVVRVRITRGGRKIPKVAGGRRPRRAGRFFTLNKPGQVVAEEKASRKYRNMQVLNSYWVGEDGKSRWFEVILADPSSPAVRNDNELGRKVTGKQRGRANRGLTSAGRKARGLLNRGKKG